MLGSAWSGPVVMGIFLLLHFVLTRDELSAEIKVVAGAILIGLTMDSALALSQAVSYDGGLRVGVVPLWMLALWAGFGATLRHSHRVFVARPRWAILIGLIGGPAAYGGGEALGRLTIHGELAYLAVAVAWATALGLLAVGVRQLDEPAP